MLLGCLVGLATPDGNVVSGLTGLTQGISVLVIVVLSFGIAASNAMELYCGALSAITVLQTLLPSWSGKARARAITAIVQRHRARDRAVRAGQFLAGYTNFILLLLYVLVPWTAINLVDYYLVCHGEYDVDSFFRQDGGIYGRFNTIAVGSYFIGIVAQAPFMATDLYTGELASRLGGADVSWIVGLSLTSLVYYAGASCSRGRCRASRERFVSAGHSVLTNARRIIRSRPRLPSAACTSRRNAPSRARPFPECAMKRARLGEAEPAAISATPSACPRSSDWASAPRSSSLIAAKLCPSLRRRRRSVAGVVPRRTASVSKSGHSAAGSAFNCARVRDPARIVPVADEQVARRAAQEGLQRLLGADRRQREVCGVEREPAVGPVEMHGHAEELVIVAALAGAGHAKSMRCSGMRRPISQHATPRRISQNVRYANAG